MTLGEKLIPDVWDLGEGSRPNKQKDRSSVIKHYTKTPERFQYFKSYDRLYQRICELCDIFSSSVTDPSQADFVESAVYLIHYWH